MSGPTVDERTADTDPRPPLTTTTSIKPALSVLVLAVLTLASFGIIDIVTSQDVRPLTPITVVGGLAIDKSSTALQGCLNAGNPPANVASGFLVPIQTTDVGGADDQTSDPASYDCSQTLKAPFDQAKILGFYVSELRSLGWSLYSSGPAAHTGKAQDLFQIAGDDTFYWEAGVTITNSSAGSTTWTLRFFQDDAID